LAALYGINTGNFNKSISRNQRRFPQDFAFRLTSDEWNNLIFQFGISSLKWGGRRTLPMAFTEHGVTMAANLLKSDRAIEVSVEIVRTFIKMREFLNSQSKLAIEMSELKSFLLKHSSQNSQEFRHVWAAIEKLGTPQIEKGQRRIGFDLDKQK
jgi:phage regulator Rha-like protein